MLPAALGIYRNFGALAVAAAPGAVGLPGNGGSAGQIFTPQRRHQGGLITQMPVAHVGTVLAIVRQHLQVPFTDSIVADSPAPARARIRPGGAPRAGNADDVHAGPEACAAGPRSCDAADAQRGWPTPRA